MLSIIPRPVSLPTLPRQQEPDGFVIGQEQPGSVIFAPK